MEDVNATSELFTFGFVTGDKTLSTEHRLAEPVIPSYEMKSKSSDWKDIYRALEESVIECCQKSRNPVLLLSGGMDSRVLAGIIAKNKFDVKTLTFGYIDKERKIASEIASTLGLENECVKMGPYEILNDIQYMKEIVKNSLGTITVIDFIHVFYPFRSCKVYDHNSTLIWGAWGTEVWADSMLGRFDSAKGFVHLFLRRRYKFPVIQERYVRIAAANLLNYCKNIDLRSILFETYVKARLKSVESRLGKEAKSPIINSKVLTETFSLPIDQRKDKLVNRLILKHKLPDLYDIPDIHPIRSYIPLWERPIIRLKNWIRRKLGIPRVDAYDLETFARRTPSLKTYIRLGIPSMSNKDLCENVIHIFYDKKVNVSRSLYRFLTYYLFQEAFSDAK